MDKNIFERVDDYSNLLAPEDEVLKQTIVSLEKENIPQISISANQGKFLQVMAKLVKAKRILELGTLEDTALSGWREHYQVKEN